MIGSKASAYLKNITRLPHEKRIPVYIPTNSIMTCHVLLYPGHHWVLWNVIFDNLMNKNSFYLKSFKTCHVLLTFDCKEQKINLNWLSFKIEIFYWPT